MGRAGHDIVDVNGDDVLIIKPSIINLVIRAPDTGAGGRSRTVVADAGEMTLYMEFYDSMTNDKIGIVIDPRLAADVVQANTDPSSFDIFGRSFFFRITARFAQIT